jgi:hypothetical protein
MTRTKTFLIAAAAAVASWMMTARAQAPTGSQGDQPPAGDQPSAAAPSRVAAGQLMTTSATIAKVDADKRELTLKDEKGKPFTISVPESVSRLDNVKPGDRLQVSFYESVAVSLAKPGTTRGQEQSTAVERAPGELPGGAVAQQTTTTAKITSITPSKDELTIEGPGGRENTIKVNDAQVRSQLGHLKVGDKVRATYTLATATRVTRSM